MPVVVYEDPNFCGTRMHFGAGVHKNIIFTNASIKVDSGTIVLLRGNKFTRTLIGPIEYGSMDVNDSATSMRIYTYRPLHKKAHGTTAFSTKGSTKLAQGSNNTQAKALYVSKDTAAIVCAGYDINDTLDSTIIIGPAYVKVDPTLTVSSVYIIPAVFGVATTTASVVAPLSPPRRVVSLFTRMNQRTTLVKKKYHNVCPAGRIVLFFVALFVTMFAAT